MLGVSDGKSSPCPQQKVVGPGQMLRVGLPVEQAAPLICELLAWEPGACQEPGRSSQLLVVASPELITPPPPGKYS